jgi:hypothetical protein
MNQEQLARLLAQEESVNLEFKESLDLDSNYNKANFLREVLSLANSPIQTGYLVIGIEDKSKDVVGIEGITEEQIQQVVVEWCRRPISFDFHIIEIKGKNVGVMQIYPIHQPYTLKKPISYEEFSEDAKGRKRRELRANQVFLRRGSIIAEAEVDEIIEMAQRDVQDLGDVVAQLTRITDWLDEISSSLGKPRNESRTGEYSRTVETTFIAMITGLFLAWVWEINPALVPILAYLISCFAIVITTSLRLTHFGIVRAIVTSLLIGLSLSLIFINSQSLVFAGQPVFGEQVLRLTFGLFVGAVCGIISQLVAGWLEMRTRG